MNERIDNDVSCCASVGLYSRCRVVAAANQEPAHKAVSNEDIADMLPPPQRHYAVPAPPNPADARPLASADAELLNLQLYR